MRLKAVSINDRDIVVEMLYNGEDEHAEEEERIKTIHEAPMPEFTAAIKAIGPVAVRIVECDARYAEGVVIRRLSLDRTKHGTRSVSITWDKPLKVLGGATQRQKTPYVRIDKPADGEEGKPMPSAAAIALIEEAIKQARLYYEGHRSQLTFDELLEPDPGDGQQESLL